MRPKAILREPLLHFLVLGAAIFLASAWVEDGAVQEPDRIVVGAERVAWLSVM